MNTKMISHTKKTGTACLLNRLKRWAVAGGTSLLVLLGPAVAFQEPDNTKTNQQDRAQGGTTAEQQAENQVDRDLTKKIRKAITDDKSLSTYAHNVKVIARGGSVTLKGPVRSEDEKAAIAAKAVEIAGAANVKNELSVKPKSEK
jgi:hyperosmotically inducible periplasmic protein